MGTLLVESPFYARPAEIEDAVPRNPTSPASAESRIIDIKYQEANGNYDAEYYAQMISNATELQTLSNLAVIPIANDNHSPSIRLHGLDRIL
jgi:hypothetical protein